MKGTDECLSSQGNGTKETWGGDDVGFFVTCHLSLSLLISFSLAFQVTSLHLVYNVMHCSRLVVVVLYHYSSNNNN